MTFLLTCIIPGTPQQLARRDTAGRKSAYQALNTTLQRAAGFDTFGYNCGCCGRPSAFINDNGRCTRPACREAMA